MKKTLFEVQSFQEVKFSKTHAQIFFKLCQGKLPKVFNQSIKEYNSFNFELFDSKIQC